MKRKHLEKVNQEYYSKEELISNQIEKDLEAAEKILLKSPKRSHLKDLDREVSVEVETMPKPFRKCKHCKKMPNSQKYSVKLKVKVAPRPATAYAWHFKNDLPYLSSRLKYVLNQSFV